MSRRNSERSPLLLSDEENLKRVEIDEDDEKSSTNKTIVGLITAAVIVVCLIGLTELSSLEERTYKYSKPWLAVWMSISLNIVVFPIYWIITRFTKDNQGLSWREEMSEILHQGRFTSWGSIFLMCFISTSLFASEYYFYLLSVSYTSAGSTIAIFNSSAVFIYILSIFFLKESVTLFKVLAVVLCLAGCVLIGLADQEDSGKEYHRAWLGDLLAGVSAALFSVYMVQYNYYITKPKMGIISLYCSIIGFICLVLFCPVFPILNHYGLESFSLPQTTGAIWSFVGVEVSLFVVNIVIWIATPITSPLFIAVANMLAIPVSDIVDYFIARAEHKPGTMTPLKIGGMALVLVGFTILELKPSMFKRCMKKENSNNIQ